MNARREPGRSNAEEPQKEYDPAERAAEKRRSREADAHALASGDVSRDELRARNAFLSPEGGRINFDDAGPESLW